MPKRTYSQHKYLTGVSVVLAWLVLLTVGVVWALRTSSEKSTDSVIYTNATTTASNGMTELTVPGYFEAPEGYAAICVPVTFKNVSGSAHDFIPVEEVSLSSQYANYAIEGVPTCGGIGGTFQTGEIRQGELGFIVANTETSFDFMYNPIDNRVKRIEVRGVTIDESN